MTMQEIINKVLTQYGKEVLLNGDRFCSVVNDFASKYELENKIIRRLNQEKILTEIYNVINDSHLNEDALKRLDAYLNYSGFSVEWKNIVYEIFSLSLNNAALVTSNGFLTDNPKTMTKNGKKKCLGKNQAASLYTNLSRNSEIIIPGEFQIIGKYAFEKFGYSTHISRVILKFGVEEIQDSAFDHLIIDDYIEIPDSVVRIGDYFPIKLGEYGYVKCSESSYAYNYCKDHRIKNSIDGIPERPSTRKITKDIANNMTYKNEKELFIAPKEWDTKYRNALIIDDARSVEKGAFRGRNDIEVLYIKSDVCYIKQNAFRDCTNLRFVFIEHKVKIASYAFANCRKLKYMYFLAVDGEYDINKTAFEPNTDIAIFNPLYDIDTDEYNILTDEDYSDFSTWLIEIEDI
ncbi:MAG: leucine-rich repeat protein [Ruminococcus sp.]|nr:leucine-rich repeat protein [Ruminococcus sp.]